ncbi:MAG: hypothetical protein Hyperionvirus21_29 [Hyperionvirus sp.]|uniref:Class I SAM-dependent methyltransferase n=1 Tax=Hyperionvirus sp. TaxID=2487770 RepID=A0A3G5AAL9_9VIRU|nr:MAG: hypothetical protein Hyperionvirus21_29 [Hyperionvirus sp.]
MSQCFYDTERIPKNQIGHGNGYCYYYNFPSFGLMSDTTENHYYSKLSVYENGIELKQPHSIHEDIRNKGLGRFSHWSLHIFFSATDNSDPRYNDKIYTFRIKNVGNQIIHNIKDYNPSSFLNDLGKKYGTEKVDLGYCVFYDALLDHIRSKAQKILEIGVFMGASILMWKDYFDNAVIYGLDHFERQEGIGDDTNNSLNFFEILRNKPDPRISLHRVNQSKAEELEEFLNKNIKGTFDVIIDDGSHLMKDQQLTLAHLFPLIRPGGYYIIEDLFSSKCTEYDVLPDGSNSTLLLITTYLKTLKWESVYMNESQKTFLSEFVDSCQLVKSSRHGITCIIRRKINIESAIMSSRHIQKDKIIVINFATDKNTDVTSSVNFNDAQLQQTKWIKEWGINDVICYSINDLDNKFLDGNYQIFKYSKGVGYYLWKPYFILATLLATDAQYIVYCDCSVKLKHSLEYLLERVRNSSKNIFGYKTGLIQKEWTKRDAFILMDCDDINFAETEMVATSAIIFRNNIQSIEFLKKWLYYCSEERIITDIPNVLGKTNYPGFQENRHDQSIFSLLCKKNEQCVDLLSFDQIE